MAKEEDRFYEKESTNKNHTVDFHDVYTKTRLVVLLQINKFSCVYTNTSSKSLKRTLLQTRNTRKNVFDLTEIVYQFNAVLFIFLPLRLHLVLRFWYSLKVPGNIETKQRQYRSIMKLNARNRQSHVTKRSTYLKKKSHVHLFEKFTILQMSLPMTVHLYF